jgi:hypothetical protein
MWRDNDLVNVVKLVSSLRVTSRASLMLALFPFIHLIIFKKPHA